MYLKIADRISPRTAAKILQSDATVEQIDWDYENVYEWAYLNLPGVGFVRNVTRDHGMSEVPDEDLDLMTEEELESLSSSGPTYIFAVASKTGSPILDIDEKVAQWISDALGMEVVICPGKLYIKRPDPEPIGRVEPKL